MNESGVVPTEEGKTRVSLGVQTEQIITLRRKLDLDKSISTPPSELRKEIYYLRDELSEAYEFHDLELQMLKEEYELCTEGTKRDEKYVNGLEKSLKDAEQIILEANKDISYLKTINQDLNEKLKEEYDKYEALKAQHEEEVSKFQITLKKKDLEIENLKKDKDDFDFRLELINQNYERKISELKSVLDKKNENERNTSLDELERRLNEENEKTKDLSKKLEDLNLELISSKERVKLLEEQLAESGSKSIALKDISLQTDEVIQENGVEAQLETTLDEYNINLLFNDGKTARKSIDVTVQTEPPKDSEKEIEEIRCTFEKEIKELKNEHNNQLKSLECSNENLKESNNCLNEKLTAANKVVEELKAKLVISIENVDDLRRQLEEIKLTETSNDSNGKLTEELKSATEEIASLKENHEKVLKDLELTIEELKLEKDTLNSIIANKDGELSLLIGELNETKAKLEERERELKTHVKDSESYVELLTSEKAELENWIKTKEEEINNLNVIVENELIKLKTDSELKIDEIREMYEVEVKNLKNENEALCEEIESIRNMYDTEILKIVNMIESEKVKNTSVKKVSSDSEADTLLGDCITKIKVERDSLVEMFNSKLMDNIKDEDISDASTVIQQSNLNELMPLVPVRNGKYSNETIGNYNLHVMDEDNMQLKIHSESAMVDFVNEFAKEMLSENIMNPEELKTCTNVFYALLNKYLILLEMYSRLKQEFEEYKVNEKKERVDIVNRTVWYLDTLCSQLEISGSSLNLSNSSFMSFQEGLPSSTIMEEDYTEMEISAVNNVTMSKDPLSLTQDITLKTPMKTPFKSAKKTTFQFKTPLRSVSKPVRTPMRTESVKKPILRTPASVGQQKLSGDTQLVQLKNSVLRKDKELAELKELYNRKFGSAEDVIQETLKNFALLEKRIAKLEMLTAELQIQRDSVIKESAELKESLTKSSEEIADLRGRLIVEIISLNPELEGTLSEVSVIDLLSTFLHTIMESCKKMPEELSDRLKSEVEALTEKNEMYESKIFESAKEMNLLKEINAALLEEKEIIEKTIADQTEEISNLKRETCELKGLKTKVKDLEERLTENDSMLQTEIYLKENTLKDLQKLKTFFEDVEKENSCLKEKIEQSDRVMRDLKTELALAKKEQMNNEMKEDELIKEIEQLKCILSDAEGRNKDLQNVIENFEDEVTAVKGKNQYKTCQLEMLNKKITDAENLIQERDQIIHELKREIARIEEKLESGSELNLKYKKSQEEIEELRQTVDGYKESVKEEIETLKNKLTTADADLSSKMKIIQELSTQLEEARENARVQEETIASLKERVEMEKEQLKVLESELEKRQETEKVMADEIESLKTKIAASESHLTGDVQKLSVELGKAEELKIKHLEELEASRARLESMESALEKYKEVERVMAEETESLKSKLLQSESELKEKIEKLTEITALVEETKERQVKNEETIKQHLEEIEDSKARLESMESALEKCREVEKVMAEETESLKLKLLQSEAELKENVEKLAEMTALIEETKERQTKDEETIKQHLEEIEDSRTKLETMESALEKYKEVEKVMTEETESLKSKLLQSETELKNKIEKLAEMTAIAEETKERQTKDEETISSLQVQVQEMETDRARLEELESAMEKLRETEKNMTEKIQDLNSRLEDAETEKTEMAAKIEETKENNDVISALQKEVEDLRNDNKKLRSLEEIIQKHEEFQVKMENLNLKLSSVESEMTVKTELIEKMTNELEEAEKVKIAYEKTISALNDEMEALKKDVFNFETVQNLLEVARNERNEKEMLIEDLNNRLNEFTASEKSLNEEIESFRRKLTEAEESEKEKLAKLGEIERDLITARDALIEVQADNKRLKEIENELIKVKTEVETRNKQLETVNGELTQKVKSFEVLYDMNCKEIQMLREELTASTDALNSSKAETERLEKRLEEMEANMEEAVAKLKTEIDRLRSKQSEGDDLQDIERKTIIEKMNYLFVLHGQEVERLQLELENSKEAGKNLQTEIDKLNAEKIVKKPEIPMPLKTPPVTKRNRPGESPSFISRRLEKLEDLNDLLTGTLQKIIRTLNIPFEDNFFSVGRYESSEAQIMKYISTLNVKNACKGDATEEELSKAVKELRNTVSAVVRHVGLPDGDVNGQLIIDQIDKMIANVKKDFSERIDILRQDNQHLDDDNHLLQTEMKKLVELNNVNKAKLSALAKSEELVKAEVEVLKAEITKLQSKNKVSRKSDLCNRKLDKLEELHQSVIDLLKKMLALTGLDNISMSNLATMRTFEIERKRVWDHFTGWVTAKTKEVEDLKTQLKELDEECESYSKVIIETRKESERIWEKSRGEVKQLELRIAELQKENEALQEKLQNGGDVKDGPRTKYSAELKKENLALQSRIKDLEESLSEARKQIEELDEECESYAKVIKETQAETLMCEETKKTIEALKKEVENLRKEKEELLERIRAFESTGDNHKGKKDGKEVKELKRTVALREMKILELEQLNEKNIIHKSQIKYLESSLAALKDQLAQEEARNQKLQREVEELSLRARKRKGSDDVELLDQLRARDSLGMAALNQIDDKEKLQKLEKDNRMLKEICRTRYNEIKRLETENQSLKGHERTTKNSNQMNSPIRTRCNSGRFKKY